MGEIGPRFKRAELEKSGMATVRGDGISEGPRGVTADAMKMDPAAHRGLMLRVTVRDKRIIDVAEVPININSVFQASVALAPKIPSRPDSEERKTTALHGQ